MPIGQHLIDELRKMPGVTVHGITDAGQQKHRVPTVSITHAHHRSEALAKALGAQGINVWSGHNYAFELARTLGLDENDGVLRIGLAHYNTVAEVDRVIASLKSLLA